MRDAIPAKVQIVASLLETGSLTFPLAKSRGKFTCMLALLISNEGVLNVHFRAR